MNAELREALDHVARRIRRMRLLGALTVCWLFWAICGVGLLVAWPGHSITVPAVLAAAAAASCAVCFVTASQTARDRRAVARRVESKYPALGTGLLAAVEADESSLTGGLGYLQSAVIHSVLDQRRGGDWNEAVPSKSLRGATLAHASSLVLFIAAFATLALHARSASSDPLTLGTDRPSADVRVDPGDTELEKGTTLLVVARFAGAVPAEASLVHDDETKGEQRRPMTRSLEDPTFAGRVESVTGDLSYRVEFRGGRSERYRVKVFEYPELIRTDAHLVFPDYASIEPKVVEDIRHVTAVEGTELTLVCRLNKDVAVARLVDEENQETALTPREEGPHVRGATFTLTQSHRYKVQLVDREGRSNKIAAELVVNVTRNRPAVVKVTRPSRDVRVSPLEELKLQAQLEDDYGVARYGLTYEIPGKEPREVVLNGAARPARKLTADHILDFESIGAAPDQLATYFFWAEDVGPDGQPRRSSGDMFFAEVRHFEEIFRQGEQPPSGSASEQQGGNAQQAGQLAELQKQIVNGTWKLIRLQTGGKPSPRFVEDGKVLAESQQAAIDQAAQLGARLQDQVSKANLEQATGFMKEAQKRLRGSVDGPSIAALTPALAAEQAAYQALLKLRAREFQVVRNNSRQRQQSGGASAGGPSQRELQELELSPDENRYEEQRAARASENLTQREKEQVENRQVLNRLKELAQRQNDLNARLKELQSALEAAKEEQARTELERQLERLRDEQQQILRDTDEVRERMEREENRDRMAEARQQIEQSRERVRQASESLEEGRLSQAVTESARAGRQLDEVREDLRKKTADRFSEEMTEMREQARRLDEEQGKLTEKLAAGNRRPQTALRDGGERQEVQQGLEEQRKQLDQILERMRSTVQSAEETEPLLAKELFDTTRKATEERLPDALKVTQQLVEAGIPEEAVKLSRRAGQGIEQLRAGWNARPRTSWAMIRRP